MNHWITRVRARLTELLTNPGVFMLAAFTVSGLFTPGALDRWRSVIELNVLRPWGLALCMVRLTRANSTLRQRPDIGALFVLLAWLIVPFALRFGPTPTNINTWQNFAILFFGLYALTTESKPAHFYHQLRVTTALFAVITALFGFSLLYCALNVQGSTNADEFGFGVYLYRHLCAAQHYNATGMLFMCATFICLSGALRGGNPFVRLLHLLPAAASILIVILSQSRTARYSLLFGLALGAYGTLASGRWHPRALLRHACGILAGMVVLVGGYWAASCMTDAALAHYARVQAMREAEAQAAQTPFRNAQEAQPDAQPEMQPEMQPQVPAARGLGDSTFTGRTGVWKNIFAMWRAQPKYFLIGNGVDRTSRDILIGTPLEQDGANMAHNAFIQFTMDHGLIGFLLLLCFALTTLKPVLRTFYAAPDPMSASGRCMCMLIAACLLTAMMENEPLNAMRPCNVALFYALACAVRLGRKPPDAP